MSKPQNPPAFPHPTYFNDQEPGMTLRDYFAAKAMQGWLSSFAEGVPSPDGISEYAYRVADSMLVEREKEPS